jgi:hypothetical protein
MLTSFYGKQHSEVLYFLFFFKQIVAAVAIPPAASPKTMQPNPSPSFGVAGATELLRHVLRSF